jgi:hypothetical protein
VSTEETIQVAGLQVLVVRKAIGNLHLGVYPPDGHVRIAVPAEMPASAVRAAIAQRLPWIRRHQAAFSGQARESLREMVNGETHWYLGRRLRLKVVEADARPGIRLAHSVLELSCPPDTSAAERRTLLDGWYRARLREVAAPMVDLWAERLDVSVADWRVRKMRTKWGSCAIENRRVWLNVELAKKPRRCIEYIVAHELLHLRVRRHGEAFGQLMDEVMPHWAILRAELGALPIPVR